MADEPLKNPKSRNLERRKTVASMRHHIVDQLQNQEKAIQPRLGQKPRKVMILNTGGTISMFPSTKGYVTQKGALYSFLQNNPYSCDQDFTYFEADQGFLITPLTVYHRRIWYKVFELEKLIDSSNMNSQDWITIATNIEQNYANFDSFIILHGTDTMAYTASALSFMFQNLSKTVILTGSQVPLSQPRNDGFRNLLSSLTVAGHFTIPEVMICFNDKLYRGNRSKKVDSVSLESFGSPKFQPLGDLGVQIKIEWDLIQQSKGNSNYLRVEKQLCDQISVLRLNPLLNIEGLHQLLNNSKLKGLVLETFGAGNMQTDPLFLEEIRKAKERGISIVNISQCHKSQVELLYETGILYYKLGVIPGGDMTTEAAITKLSYLLGLGLTQEQISSEFPKNLRGEITPPSNNKTVNEPFLVALSRAITSQTDMQNVDINKDLVFPNILCQLCLQKKPLSSIDISNIEINYAAQDYDLRTVLHVAAREGSVEVVELMLKEAPEMVNSEDRWGHSPLYEAMMSKNLEVIHMLVSHGGKLIAPMHELTSYLCKAIKFHNLEAFQLFLQAGVKDFQHFRTRDDRTLAHVAVTFKFEDAIKFLRTHDETFDWNAKDRFGRGIFE